MAAGGSVRMRPLRSTMERTGRLRSRHHVTSVVSPNVQMMAMPVPLSACASSWAPKGPPGLLTDRLVGQRPVDGQADVAPHVLERLLVLGGEGDTELDEVGTRAGNLALGIGLVRRPEVGVVGEGGIAAGAVDVLDP